MEGLLGVLVIGMMYALPFGAPLALRLGRHWKESRGLRRQLQLYPPAGDKEPVSGRCAAQGVVSCQGTLLNSPISGQAVVAWRVAVMGYKYGRFGRPHRRCLHDHTEMVDFSVEAGSAVADVVCEGGEFLVQWEKESFSTMTGPFPQRISEYLRREEITLEDSIFNTVEIACHEARLAPGQHVTVFGMGELGVDPAAAGSGYRTLASRWIMRGTQQAPLFISNMTREQCLSSAGRLTQERGQGGDPG